MTNEYDSERIAFWDNIAKTTRKGMFSRFYHELLCKYYLFFTPPGLQILELGCGEGDLLHNLRPSRGVGVDFSKNIIKKASFRYPDLEFICADAHDVNIDEKFDIIILSNILNDCEDVQKLLMNIRKNCHNRTRIIINYFNNAWRIPLTLARRLRLARPLLEQNWLAPQDIKNLLTLSGFEEISKKSFIALPVAVPLITNLLNRFFIHIFPFSLFALTNFSISRPVPEKKKIEELTVSVIIAARNEAGHIEELLERIPPLGKKTEIGTAAVTNNATFRYVCDHSP